VFVVAGELTIPILPCRLLDDVLQFYEVLGFQVSYRQARPNPYAVVRREDIQLHFVEPDGFDPEQSYGSAIVVVPDADALYRSFADGLRAAYGKLPRAGIPRILRPREKLGTVAGFSVVDPGGNWLRIYRSGDSEDAQDNVKGLALVLRSAARQGDARGDDATALKMLDAGLARHAGAPAIERLPALVYRAELATRMGNRERAMATLAEIRALDLDDDARVIAAADLATAAELERDLA
jgi:catechol 2,3-dioxygenase-like lactoylglutathione lyase family enzyme